MDIRILGPIEVRRDGSPITLSRGKQRTLLAVLVLRRNRVVSADRLIAELWGDEPPRTAATALQGLVASLRKLLGRERVSTEGSGYRLRVDEEELDADRFEALLAGGDARAALGLWRGPALEDVADEPFAQTEIARLTELRLIAVERRLSADVDGQRTAHAVSELEALIAEHPYRERLRLLLMLALYRGGRQADALAEYQAARAVLVGELGIEPSAELRALHRQILEHDPALVVAPGAPRTAPVEALRRRATVTVLYCDLVGSTGLADRLDAEAFRSLMERFIDACSEAIERHEGVVADLSGDAVIGAFGLERAREDDALRAVRAAVELPETLVALELEVRVGLATGEIVAGGVGGPLAGAAVNLAARLQEKARPGGVVLDDATHRRCGEAVTTRAVTFRLKGKSEPVRAHHLRDIVAGGDPIRRRFDVPLVGRERELADLRDTYTRAAEQRAPALVTIRGAAGAGKTRLAQEFVSALGETPWVLRGRCLPYGDGVSYLPLRDVVVDAFGTERTSERLAEALAGEQDGGAVARAVEAAFGRGQSTGNEIAWAVRRLLETLARRRPVVVVLEDIHWADDTLLDLLEYLARSVREAPLLLLCLARPELWEKRESWASSVTLAPLSDRECRALVRHLLPSVTPSLVARVVGRGEGNPLFVEHLLAHALEGSAAAELPDSLQALLAARIDALGADERALVETAAVVGPEFRVEAVAALLPEEARPSVARHLASLARRELVQAHASALAADGFRFGHILVRDAAYAAIPKAFRAELHERHASWLRSRTDEQDEVIGYHLEQACLNLADLGRVDGYTRALRGRAAERLGAAGRSAFDRGDYVAAIGLLGRALRLAPEGDDRRPELLVPFARSLWQLARFPESRAALAEAVELARRLGDSRNEIRARLWLRRVDWSLEPDVDVAELEREARSAAVRFEAHSDHAVAYEAWFIAHVAAFYSGWFEPSFEALERALDHGRRAGTVAARAAAAAIMLHLWGPQPSSVGLARARELLSQGELGRADEADVLDYMAPLLAIRGEFEAARASVRRALVFWREAGVLAPDTPDWLAEASVVELVAGDWEAAERALRIQCAHAERPGREPVLATAAAMLSNCLYEQGRDDEAGHWVARGEQHAPVHDPNAQVLWRSARAKLLARGGSHEHAEALARDAVARSERTDWIWGQADAHMDLAEVLAFAGKPKERADAVVTALELYERKEHLVGAERARRLLADLGVDLSAGGPRAHLELRHGRAPRTARDRGDELVRLERIE